MKWLILAFIAVPTAELALLIYSGKTLGLFPTIAIILITGIGGAYLAKRQGTKAWNELKCGWQLWKHLEMRLLIVFVFFWGDFAICLVLLRILLGFLLTF